MPAFSISLLKVDKPIMVGSAENGSMAKVAADASATVMSPEWLYHRTQGCAMYTGCRNTSWSRIFPSPVSGLGWWLQQQMVLAILRICTAARQIALTEAKSNRPMAVWNWEATRDLNHRSPDTTEIVQTRRGSRCRHDESACSQLQGSR